MVTFSIPETIRGKKHTQKTFFSFSVLPTSVMFAGSRDAELPAELCKGLIEGFAQLGFSFYVGCASGVDACFRKALSHLAYRDISFVACAFASRTKPSVSYGLYASVVVPKNLSPKAALRRRTLWMVKRASLAVLFPQRPSDGSWGRGSQLVFRACLYQLKPLFVVSSRRPPLSAHYRVLRSSLFGVVDGWWVVPHPVEEGGTCDEEY